MTILTALAVFTIGIVTGIFVTWHVMTAAINRMCDGRMKLVAIHRCEEGHIHAKIVTAEDTPFLEVTLQDGVPERTERAEETPGHAA